MVFIAISLRGTTVFLARKPHKNGLVFFIRASQKGNNVLVVFPFFH